MHKGPLVSYIEGSRKKVLELENYYKKIDEIDHAKRDIFRRYKRYSAKEMLEFGISMAQARFFKQAIIACEKNQFEQVMNEYAIETLKKGESSILCLGQKLENYEPLLRKGWEI